MVASVASGVPPALPVPPPSVSLSSALDSPAAPLPAPADRFFRAPRRARLQIAARPGLRFVGGCGGSAAPVPLVASTPAFVGPASCGRAVAAEAMAGGGACSGAAAHEGAADGGVGGMEVAKPVAVAGGVTVHGGVKELTSGGAGT